MVFQIKLACVLAAIVAISSATAQSSTFISGNKYVLDCAENSHVDCKLIPFGSDLGTSEASYKHLAHGEFHLPSMTICDTYI